MKVPRRGRDTQLALRQQLIVLRSAELRAGLASEAAACRASLSWTSRLTQGVGWLCDRPALPLGLAAAALMLRPAGALRWAMRLWSGWRLWKAVSPWLAEVQRRPPGR